MIFKASKMNSNVSKMTLVLPSDPNRPRFENSVPSGFVCRPFVISALL